MEEVVVVSEGVTVTMRVRAWATATDCTLRHTGSEEGEKGVVQRRVR